MGNTSVKPAPPTTDVQKCNLFNANREGTYCFATGKWTSAHPPTSEEMKTGVVTSVDIEGTNIREIILECQGLYAMITEYPEGTNRVEGYRLCNMDFPMFRVKHTGINLLVTKDYGTTVTVTPHIRLPTEEERKGDRVDYSYEGSDQFDRVRFDLDGVVGFLYKKPTG